MNILYSAPTTVVKSHIIEVANNFAELGHKVHLVTFWKNKPEINPDITWYNASLRNRHMSELLNEYVIKFGKSYFKDILKLFNKGGKGSLFKVVLNYIIDDNKIDFIYERYNSGSPTSKIGKNKHIPVILELNGIWPFDAKDKGFSESFCNEQLKLDLEALSLATTVRVVGTGIRDYYVKHGIDEKKIHIIGNGANTEHFRPMNRDACRERLGIAKNKKIIGFSGSFQFYVGLEHIIRAMPLVLEKVPDAHLFLMGRRLPKGSGVSDKDIMGLVTELDLPNNITVFPDCLYADMPYYINAFDVCLVPLTSERNEFSG